MKETVHFLKSIQSYSHGTFLYSFCGLRGINTFFKIPPWIGTLDYKKVTCKKCLKTKEYAKYKKL